MPALDLTVVAEFETFADRWKQLGYDEPAARRYWRLLSELQSGELLVHLPEWLAEEKLGYHTGRTPTAFVIEIDRETDQAIKISESTAAEPLSELVERIHSLEDSIERLSGQPDTDPERLEWLKDRLNEKRQAFSERSDMPTLADDWLPKSQLEFIGRRAPTS